GLRCAAARFPESSDTKEAAAPALQRCATNSFAGQSQTVDILLDPMTSAVTGLDFAVAGKAVRMQGKGSIPEQPPGGAVLLASTAAGDVLEFALAPDFHYAGSDRLKRFGELSDGSRARVAGLNFKQVSDLLTAPQALPLPQL